MITQNCEYCGEIADCDINGLCDDCQTDPEALLEAGSDDELTRPGAHPTKNVRQTGAPNTHQSGEKAMVAPENALAAVTR